MIFTRNKKRAVSNFVLKLVNNNCLDIRQLQDGPRSENRVNLTVVVLVIPLENKELAAAKAFQAVTKDFTTTSVAIVVDAPRSVSAAILAFRYEGEMYYARAKARHHTPLGGGFHQLGFQLEEMVSPADYPGLSRMSF
ncbi:MAG: hypothetical protein IT426_12420 [Pirellulales bacterium]|nr:hypothetical protein [Pirellulales bacterium]